MQQSVEDEESWGGSSMALEEMGVTVLTGAYNIESEEVRRRISAADILVIAARVKELLRTGADAPLDAMALVKLPQVEEGSAGNSDAAAEWLAWKEAVLGAIESSYPQDTASKAVPPSPSSVGELAQDSAGTAGAGAEVAAAVKTVDEWLGRFQPLGLSTGLGRRMCSTSEGSE